MATKDRIKLLSAQNPKADEAQIRHVLELLRKLRTRGTESKGYNLVNPFTRRSRKESTTEDDPRAVILR